MPVDEPYHLTVAKNRNRWGARLVIAEVAPGSGRSLEILPGEHGEHGRGFYRVLERQRERWARGARGTATNRVDEHELNSLRIAEHGVHVGYGAQLFHTEAGELLAHRRNQLFRIRHDFVAPVLD